METFTLIMIIYGVVAAAALAAFTVKYVFDARDRKRRARVDEARRKELDEIRRKYPYRRSDVVSKVFEKVSASADGVRLAGRVPVWDGKYTVSFMEVFPDSGGERTLLMLRADGAEKVYLHYGLLNAEEQNEVMKVAAETLGIYCNQNE